MKLSKPVKNSGRSDVLMGCDISFIVRCRLVFLDIWDGNERRDRLT